MWVVTDKFSTWVMPICDLEKGYKPERLFFGACLFPNLTLTRVTEVTNSELNFIWFLGNRAIWFFKNVSWF